MPRDEYGKLLENSLSKIFNQTVKKAGNTPIYTIGNDRVIARASRVYDGQKPGYWYGIKAIDPERIKKYAIKEYVFLMVGKGAVILPPSRILDEIKKDNFDVSFVRGKLIHYHMRLFVEGNKVIWKLKNQSIDVSHLVTKTEK